ncbi:hypothetical protein [Spirillospora sp. NBC_01491]|uniref:hypothetical protein n=1 Tax=Spirillospora sp. NBC_01491 TaxID=2976007 RepID=UPI002E2FDA27|nr:hypothetical protein [Spirillospora sp. NBC_01491]
MTEFVLGVLSSLAATMMTVTGGLVASRRARQWPTVLLSRLTALGVLRTYPRQRAANADLPGELQRARWVGVLAGRGNELTRDGFARMWREAGPRLRSVRVLLPDPSGDAGSWLARRESAMRRFDPGMRPGLLADQVRANAAYLLEVVRQREAVALRFYDLPNLYRIIITDSVAYITFYEPGEHGRNSPCVVARGPGLMYDFALGVFSAAWECGRNAEEVSLN